MLPAQGVWDALINELLMTVSACTTPLMTQPSGTAWGAEKSLFGSASATSGNAPT